MHDLGMDWGLLLKEPHAEEILQAEAARHLRLFGGRPEELRRAWLHDFEHTAGEKLPRDARAKVREIIFCAVSKY